MPPNGYQGIVVWVRERVGPKPRHKRIQCMEGGLSPLQRAQALDTLADEQEKSGQYAKAIESRQSASAAYQTAAMSVQDASAKRTLQMLGSKQVMLCTELQGKAAREQQAARTRPQTASKPVAAHNASDRHGQLVPRPKRSTIDHSVNSARRPIDGKPVVEVWKLACSYGWQLHGMPWI